jgi:large subunit ribosomal protein L10
MNKSEKNQEIDALVAKIDSTPNFYLADISTLNAEDTYKLRSLCFKRSVGLQVVKNTLLRKALERATLITISYTLFSKEVLQSCSLR